ncbi:hypothetical protein C450_12815 [Halococcus salifodinae DSM 8989]|uniref:Uncharacterized protein n=2 Tax=Halococcus salifodinae TaxID=36738 RepID=M0N0G4_9EURY|nr:hypothetical protein C450_12815 [Halococcus salifodinae DSM 8989]
MLAVIGAGLSIDAPKRYAGWWRRRPETYIRTFSLHGPIDMIMDRRQYLAGWGSMTGFALLAGCSQLASRSGNESGDGESNSTNGDNGESSDSNSSGSESSDGSDDTGSDGEALETGQTPPKETGTPFENTATVPEGEGLETGQAPNETSE